MFQEGLFGFITARSGIRALLGATATHKDKTTGVFPVLLLVPTFPISAFTKT
jgi:hypothetical protein